MAVTADEMYLLTLMTYVDGNGIGEDGNSVVGMTVGQIAELMSESGFLESVALDKGKDRAVEIKTLCDRITSDNNKHLANMVIKAETSLVTNGQPGQSCYCVVSKDGKDGTLVFQGTNGMTEWKDNFQAPFVEGMTNSQHAVLDWYRSDEVQSALVGCENVYTTGHSKGGNSAKVIAIFEPRVTECVSFDGQGFSDSFLETYSAEIAAAQGKITTYSNEYDYVNVILNDVGEMRYIHPNDNFKYEQGPLTHDLFSFDQQLPLVEHATGEQGAVAGAISDFFNSYLRSNAEYKQNVTGLIAEMLGNIDNPDGMKWTLYKCICTPSSQRGVMELVAYIREYVKVRSEDGVLEALDHILPGISEVYDTINKVLNTEVFGKTVEEWISGDPSWLIQKGISAVLDILQKLGFDVEIAKLYVEMLMGDAFSYLEVNREYADRTVESTEGIAEGDIGKPLLRVNFEELRAVCAELNQVVAQLNEAAQKVVEAADYCEQCEIEPRIFSVPASFRLLQKILDMFTPAGYLKRYAASIQQAADKAGNFSVAIDQVATVFEEKDKNLLNEILVTGA